MNPVRSLFVVLLILVGIRNGKAQDSCKVAFQGGGYLKDVQSVFFPGYDDSLSTLSLIHNRLHLAVTVGSHWRFRSELRTRIFYGEQVRLLPGFGEYASSDDGYFNLTWLWGDWKSLAGISGLDRALLNYSSDRLSITAGRQRINWGLTTVWNPNDIFNAYNFLDFDYEERPGSDAVRIQYFPGGLSTIEIAGKPGRNANERLAAALLKFNRWQYDFQFLGGIGGHDIISGMGWAGNISEAGFKGELAYFINPEKSGNEAQSFTASVMVDYTFKKAWYASVSGLYIEDPHLASTTESFSSTSRLNAKALMPYRYSIYAGVMKTFSPLLSGNLSVVYSLDYSNTIFIPSLVCSLQKNVDLDLTAQCFFSSRQDGYKTLGNSIFFRIRWSY